MSARISLLVALLLTGSVGPRLAGAGPVFSAGVAAKVTADDNIFLQDRAPLAAGATQAALPADAGALIEAIGANLGLAWKPQPALALEAAYAPMRFNFSRHASENHTDHRLTASLTGAAAGWSYGLKTQNLFTQGSADSPVFNRLGGAPAIGGEPVRARRAQDVFKGSARLLRAGPQGFVRGLLAWSEQDFHTRESAAAGYANYVDRGECSAGAEAGWTVWRDLSLVTGVRQGRQHQNDLLGKTLNYTNTFTRWLAGVEQTVNPRLKFAFLAGPDVRRFGTAGRDGFIRNQTTTFIECSGTWTPGPADSVAVSGQRYLWLSSGGRGAYVDSICDLIWKHRLAPAWSVAAGVNRHTGDTGRYNPTAPRHDVILASSLALSHALGPKTRLDLSVAHEDSDTLVPGTPARAYTRTTASLGLDHAW